MSSSRYVVGIDLGTTNCAVAYVDTEAEGGGIVPLPITQVVGPGETEARPMLPSFLLLPTEHEVPPESVALPWEARSSAVVGAFARDRGTELPHRLVSSAKSWLSNRSVDRRAALLPWMSDALRISPVEASARVLSHVRDAWNHVEAAADPALRFEDQSIVLTVPASFDEEARELTVEAARASGLVYLTLLEEPVAAVYAWMSAHPGGLPEALGDGQLLLAALVV